MLDVSAVLERVRIAIAGLLRGDKRGYIGEPVSQLEHALQCAALARAQTRSPNEVLAALFHDIGHLIAPSGPPRWTASASSITRHRRRRGSPRSASIARVCALVASHVRAKRYLALRKPGYYARLSDASRGTLAFQGGPMSERRGRRFEADPLFAAKVRLRAWDEAAKEPDRASAGPRDRIRESIREHLEQ